MLKVIANFYNHKWKVLSFNQTEGYHMYLHLLLNMSPIPKLLHNDRVPQKTTFMDSSNRYFVSCIPSGLLQQLLEGA